MKSSLLILRIYNEWAMLLIHIITYSISLKISESISLCGIILIICSPKDMKNSYTKLFSHVIILLFTSGLFISDLKFLFPQILCLLINLTNSNKNKKLEEVKLYELKIIEENKIYLDRIEALQKKSLPPSPVKRSSSLLRKLKSLRSSSFVQSFTEGSDNESPASDIDIGFRSRKSSINIDDFSEAPRSFRSNIALENLLPGISNEEIKEIINALISQEYLMWNPQKCGDDEIDVIAIALEAKKVFTQSIENLPGSSHTPLRMKNAKKIKNIRSMIELSEPLGEVLESIGEWDFDCFELIKVTKDPAYEVGLYIFNTLGLCESFQIESAVLRKFLKAVEHGYNRNNFYHNSIHAADVTASTLFLVQKGLSRCGNLIELDVFALITAALCHDIGHPGVNNAFLVATGNEIAVKYNDHSCLENMHTNRAFTILRTDGCNIASGLNKADYQRFRKNVVSVILSTDLQLHFDKLNEFRINLDKHLDISDDKFRILAIQMCLKCADIGHGARTLDIHVQWTSLITKEFFKQGEREKKYEIPITPLCDINTCIVSKSQVGFLEVLVKPLFLVWENFIEENNEVESELDIKICMKNIAENIEYWNHEFQLFTSGAPTFLLDSNPPPLTN